MIPSELSLSTKSCSSYPDLSNEGYDLFMDNAHCKEIQKGKYIYFESYRHANIYRIRTALLRLGYLDNQGNKIIKEVLYPGDFFGQTSLQRENLNGEFAQAMSTTVSLSVFTIEHFNQLLTSKPTLGLQYSRISGLRIRRFENRLRHVLYNDVKTRLKWFLEELLSEVYGSSGWFGKEVCIPSFLTHEEIAQLIGTRRQTVTTLLRKLRLEN